MKPFVRSIVRLVIAVCLLGVMPALTAHPQSAKAATEYVVGSVGPAGGIVFYVATTPFKCGADLTADCTYLEAAPNSWNSGSDPQHQWGGGNSMNFGQCSSKNISGAQGQIIGTGFANTAAIMSACPAATGDNSAPAARAADIYAPSGMAADWFLPSKDELNELCKYARETGQAAGGGTVCSGEVLRDGFVSNGYWSSSETGVYNAWGQDFDNGVQKLGNNKFVSYHVRPVRAFARLVMRPTVTTNEATLVTTSSATLNATVNANSNDNFDAATVAFSYATTADLSGITEAATGTSVTGSTDKTSTVALTGLKPETKYYYRASATNSIGTSPGGIKSFTTLGGKPSATTAIASGVAANKATLNASVNANGLSTAVKYRVSKTADLTGDVTVYEGRTVTDFADESVPVSISSLSELMTYYYRVEATNSIGTATGEIKSFTTARPVGVTINSAAEFTNKKTVLLSVTGAAGSVSAIVSNDGGFGAAETFTLVDGSADINWTLISSRDERLPKQVYVKFVSRFGTQSANYQDDIILDTTAPVLSDATAVATTAPAAAVSVASVRAPKKNGAKIVVKAVDANSGIGSIEMRSGASKKATSIKYANPKAKSQTLTVNTKAKTLQIRVIDRAGNPSPWKTVKVK